MRKLVENCVHSFVKNPMNFMNLKALFVQTVTLPADPWGADAERLNGQLANSAAPGGGGEADTEGEEESRIGGRPRWRRARAGAEGEGGGAAHAPRLVPTVGERPPVRPGLRGWMGWDGWDRGRWGKLRGVSSSPVTRGCPIVQLRANTQARAHTTCSQWEMYPIRQVEGVIVEGWGLEMMVTVHLFKLNCQSFSSQ